MNKYKYSKRQMSRDLNISYPFLLGILKGTKILNKAKPKHSLIIDYLNKINQSRKVNKLKLIKFKIIKQ